MGLEMVSRVQRFQGQCQALRALGHQCYRPCSHKTDPPLHSGYKDAGHLVVHQRGGRAWLGVHITALRSWASMVTGAEVPLQEDPAMRPDDTWALSVDQLTLSHADIQ